MSQGAQGYWPMNNTEGKKSRNTVPLTAVLYSLEY
jgi:hypothetical protein